MASDGDGSGRRLFQVSFGILFLIFGGGTGYNSFRFGAAPWNWTSADWSNSFNFFGPPRTQITTQEEFEWAKLSANTRMLWDEAPRTLSELKQRLGMQGSATPAPAASAAPGATPSPGGQPAPAAVGTAPDNEEYRAGLALTETGLEHFRESHKSKAELAAAKKCFEDALVRLQRASEQVAEEQERARIEQDQKTVTRYLDDCRARTPKEQ